MTSSSALPTTTGTALEVQDPTYKRGTCNGVYVDLLCPVHGDGPPWPVDEAVCVGRRYWTCERCNSLTAGASCRNCGFGASLRIWDPAAREFADDVLRRVRPAEETDGELLIVGYEDAPARNLVPLPVNAQNPGPHP